MRNILCSTSEEPARTNEPDSAGGAGVPGGLAESALGGMLSTLVRKYGNESGAELCKVLRSPWTAAGPLAGWRGARRPARTRASAPPTESITVIPNVSSKEPARTTEGRAGSGWACIAVLAMALPMAALADVTNTQTISSGQHVSLDAGTILSSGGDLAFTGTSITPQGTAEFNSYGTGGAVLYGTLVQATLEFAASYNVTPISGGSLVAGEVFAVFTNGANYAKVWIMAVSSTSLTIEYYTYEAATGGNTPTITAVQDAGGYTANVAEGSIFVVKGANLSGSGYFATTYPLPPTFMNTSIMFTPLTGGAQPRCTSSISTIRTV